MRTGVWGGPPPYCPGAVTAPIHQRQQTGIEARGVSRLSTSRVHKQIRARTKEIQDSHFADAWHSWIKVLGWPLLGDITQTMTTVFCFFGFSSS